eukprot:2390841-Prymnesium_polylepis.1
MEREEGCAGQSTLPTVVWRISCCATIDERESRGWPAMAYLRHRWAPPSFVGAEAAGAEQRRRGVLGGTVQTAARRARCVAARARER